MSSQNHETNNTDHNDDVPDFITYGNRGCCFWIPCMSSRRAPDAGSIWWQRIGTVDSKPTVTPWWTRGWKKVREWSELVAGPRWKTFIRTAFRKNRYAGCCGGGGCVGGGGISKQSKFQYDPLSYSLNFDDGHSHLIDEDYVARDFSSRFVASQPVVSVKTFSSIDFGNEMQRAPHLT